MEAVDPNLIKASTANFDWINEGIKSGMDYAQAQGQLDIQQKNLESQLVRDKQNESLVNFQKAKYFGDNVSEIVALPNGPLKSAKLEALKQGWAIASGTPIDPIASASLTDKSQQEKWNETMHILDQMTPEQKADPSTILWINGVLGPDSAKAMEKIIQENRLSKQGIEDAAIKQTNAETAKLNAESLATFRKSQAKTNEVKAQAAVEKADDKSLDGLRKETTKINSGFQKINMGVLEARDQLAKNNSFGDIAAADAFTRAMAGRTNNLQFSKIIDAGGLADQILNKGFKLSKGQYFNPAQRAEFARSMDGILKTSEIEQREALAPTYTSAKARFPDKLNQIIGPKMLKMYEGSKLDQRSEREKNGILKLVGQNRPFDALVQGMKDAGVTPITKEEYDEAKKKLGIK